MDIRGKKITFLGDSITEGVGVSSLEHLYWNVVAKRTGAKCCAHGISGTRIAPNRIPSPCPDWDQHFASRVDELEDDADIVVIFGGTNDYGHGDAPIGTMADRTEDTFYGSLHTLYLKLIEKFPEAQIVIMTPSHRSSEGAWYINDLGQRTQAPLSVYVDEIREVAAYYALPVLDLYRVSGLQPLVPLLQERYMPDGLHPNDAGQMRIAEKLIGFLTSL